MWFLIGIATPYLATGGFFAWALFIDYWIAAAVAFTLVPLGRKGPLIEPIIWLGIAIYALYGGHFWFGAAIAGYSLVLTAVRFIDEQTLLKYLK